MSRGAVARAVLIGILVVAIGVVFGTAVPAHAAPKPIGLSTDGVTFTDTMSSSVFGGALIVPGKPVTRTFWVQNRAGDPGNLALALTDVTGTDSTFLGALSLQLTAGTTTGPSVVFATANPCRSLISGVSLASGAVIRVDATLTLASSLSGVTSQGSVGGFKLPVTLTSTDVAAPDGCTASSGGGTGGGGTGGSGGGTGGGGSGGTGAHHSTPGTIDTTTISGAADGTVPGAETGLPDADGNGYVYATRIIPNTGRFYQEFDVIGWLALLVLSGIVAWRRSRREPEDTYR
jgi:hypothetical protein